MVNLAGILEIDNIVSVDLAHSYTNSSFISSSLSQYLKNTFFEFNIFKINPSIYRNGNGIKYRMSSKSFLFFTAYILNVATTISLITGYYHQ